MRRIENEQVCQRSESPERTRRAFRRSFNQSEDDRRSRHGSSPRFPWGTLFAFATGPWRCHLHRYTVAGMAGLTRRVLATSAKFDLLGRIEAPELASVGQGAEDDLEIARVAVTVLDGELGDGRPGAAATGLALPLPAPGKRLGKPRRLRWATSLQKSFGVDPLLDREGKRMRWARRMPPATAGADVSCGVGPGAR